MGSSLSWSYDSWIYNYLCNQCIVPLKLWVRIQLMANCTEILLKVALNTITLTLTLWWNTKINVMHCFPTVNWLSNEDQARIQDFKLGGAHLKKLRRAEGGGKFFWVFRVKNHDFTPKNHIFFQFYGGRAPGAPPAESAPEDRQSNPVCFMLCSIETSGQ